MRVSIGGGRIGTATRDDEDSDVVVEMDEDVDALRCRSAAEVTRANMGRALGGVGGVDAADEVAMLTASVSWSGNRGP